MCIYCGTNKYRKIYENHYGPIPRDENSRTYEIHHIDGNHSNNDPINLKAVTIQDHYDIHHSQGDWAACLRMSSRMNISHEEKSKLGTDLQLERYKSGIHTFSQEWFITQASLRKKESYANGTHPFNDPIVKEKTRIIVSNTQKERYEKEIHQFQCPDVIERRIDALKKSNDKQLKDGTHYFLNNDARKTNLEKQFAEGKHPTQNSDLQRQKCMTSIENGTHPWVAPGYQTKLNNNMLKNGTHPSQIKKICPNCNTIVDSANYGRWHGSKCRKIN
jgi:hypothetical protein